MFGCVDRVLVVHRVRECDVAILVLAPLGVRVVPPLDAFGHVMVLCPGGDATYCLVIGPGAQDAGQDHVPQSPVTHVSCRGNRRVRRGSRIEPGPASGPGRPGRATRPRADRVARPDRRRMAHRAAIKSSSPPPTPATSRTAAPDRVAPGPPSTNGIGLTFDASPDRCDEHRLAVVVSDGEVGEYDRDSWEVLDPFGEDATDALIWPNVQSPGISLPSRRSSYRPGPNPDE